ncbi:hypothetical protein DMENIID0001_024400 [Sergentomyia squamirostris]
MWFLRKKILESFNIGRLTIVNGSWGGTEAAPNKLNDMIDKARYHNNAGNYRTQTYDKLNEILTIMANDYLEG